MVFPQLEQATFSGLSSLSTGMALWQEGQVIVGTSTSSSASLCSTNCIRFGLTSAVSIHNTDAPPDAPKTKIVGEVEIIGKKKIIKL